MGLWTGLHGHDASAMRVRVTAVTHIEARVDRAMTPGHAVVRGTLRDDVGNPLTSTHVAISFYEGAGTGAALLLSTPSPCSTAFPEPHVAPDEYVVDTDQAGDFCFEAALAIERGTMKLRYRGDADREAAAVDIPVDLGVPAVVLSFDPEPKVVSLDEPELVVSVHVNAPRVPKEGWRITLRDERQHVVGAAAVDQDGTARIPIQTRELAAPGPGEIAASLEGAPVFASSVAAPVERHARVRVETDLPSAAGVPEEGIAFHARARSVRGPVSSGSIEARLGDLSVGAATLQNGEAQVTAIFSSARAPTMTVMARYVSAAPWWEPGAAVPVTIKIQTGGTWRRVPLLVLGIALVAWVLREAYDWRLPRRRSRSPSPGPAEVAPSTLQLLRPLSAAEGWTGHITDAHDGEPLNDATIQVFLPAFPNAAETGARILASATVDDAGRFALRGTFPRGALLRVEAPHHADLEQPLPAPSELSIAMVSRRRHLLGRMVAFAAREWGPSYPGREPTPEQVARRARSTKDPAAHAARARQIEAFARATEQVAFGPGDVDRAAEATVLALEPR